MKCCALESGVGASGPYSSAGYSDAIESFGTFVTALAMSALPRRGSGGVQDARAWWDVKFHLEPLPPGLDNNFGCLRAGFLLTLQE